MAVAPTNIATGTHPQTQVSPRNEHWYRLGSLLYDAIVPAIKTVLHNDMNDPTYVGLPRNETLLYHQLNTTYLGDINRLVAKKLLTAKQLAILLPPSQKTNSEKFDATLTILLIRSLLKLPCTSPKWRSDQIQSNDVSKSACIIRARELRNFICHSDPDSMDNQTFHDKWLEGENIINDLQYQCDLQRLKVQPLDATPSKSVMQLIALEKKVDTIKNIANAASAKVGIAKQDAKFALFRVQIAETIANTSQTVALSADMNASSAKRKSEAAFSKADDAERSTKRALLGLGNVESKTISVQNLATNADKNASSALKTAKNTVKEAKVAREVGLTAMAITEENAFIVGIKADEASCKADYAETIANKAEMIASEAELKADAGMKLAESTNEKVEVLTALYQKSHNVENTQKRYDEFTSKYREAIKNEYKDVGSYVERTFIDKTNKIYGLDKIIQCKESCLINAEAGYGKTCISKTILHQWAMNENNESFMVRIDCKQAFFCLLKPDVAFFNLIQRSLRKPPMYHPTVDYEKFKDMFTYLSCKFSGKLTIIIDGIDEISLSSTFGQKKCAKLQDKIDCMQEINSKEFISALLCGYLLPNSKLIILGRSNEMNQLKEVSNIDTTPRSPIFNMGSDVERKVFRLEELSMKDIRELLCVRFGCEVNHLESESADENESAEEYESIQYVYSSDKDESNHVDKCIKVYSKFKSIDAPSFKTIPSFTIPLIEMYMDNEHETIGKVTKTKTLLYVIYNHFKKHTDLECGNNINFKFMKKDDANDYKLFLQQLGKLGLESFKIGDVVIRKLEGDNDTIQLGDKDINIFIIRKLDLFFMREITDGIFELEAYHLITLEMIVAAYLAVNKDLWGMLFQLPEERQLTVIPFILGLISGNTLSRSFVEFAFEMKPGKSLHDINQFYQDLCHAFYLKVFSIDPEQLPGDMEPWFGIRNTNETVPPFKLLIEMDLEVNIPPDLLPRTVVYTVDSIVDDWYDKKRVPTSITKRTDVRYIIKGWIGIETNNEPSDLIDPHHSDDHQVMNDELLIYPDEVLDDGLLLTTPLLFQTLDVDGMYEHSASALRALWNVEQNNNEC